MRACHSKSVMYKASLGGVVESREEGRDKQGLGVGVEGVKEGVVASDVGVEKDGLDDEAIGDAQELGRTLMVCTRTGVDGAVGHIVAQCEPVPVEPGVDGALGGQGLIMLEVVQDLVRKVGGSSHGGGVASEALALERGGKARHEERARGVGRRLVLVLKYHENRLSADKVGLVEFDDGLELGRSGKRRDGLSGPVCQWREIDRI